MQPAITVYITCYNYAAFVSQAIQSVLNQTFQDFELLVIDDGSTDGSRTVIEHYREHPKVNIIYQQNKGLNATNNVAISLAKGKYIVRLDADDYFEPEALGIMYAIMESDEKLGLVFPDYFYVDAAGNRIGSHRRHFFDDEVTLYDQPAHGACTLVRLDYLRRLGGYDEAFSCQDGFELWIKFITFHKVTNINRPLFSYRQHSGSLSSDSDKILKTRRQIKRGFVEKYLSSPNTLAIIPVRNRVYNGVSWPLFSYNGKTVLQHRIESCLQSKNIDHLVVTASDSAILAYLKEKYSAESTISIMERPEALSAFDIKLDDTIQFVFRTL
ncbi:family 2 glycosyl transferase [Nitritalea halalkaliphila LW7]|uniref:Family 2 glycosyl transferase n=1 Tax=Nitritalea halalkaliphila LW7 TaxID=1189621 RepID=I5C621_9BACT|nr:glycosyltransferase [Nitritalea halalkaliphila]EIM77273.1 family 2 glycosyl transferase [Nitritalea halalkaliphila LW7]